MPVTVYTASPPLGSGNYNPLLNFRQFVQLSAGSNGQLRVLFKADIGSPLGIVGASFGKWDGASVNASSGDMTTPPFRLTFAGSNTVTIPGSGEQYTDFVAHPGVTLSAGDWVIVAWQTAAEPNGNQYYSSGHTTALTMFHASASDLSQQQFCITAGSWAISGTGTQPGQAGGRNFSVKGVETNDPAGLVAPLARAKLWLRPWLYQHVRPASLAGTPQYYNMPAETGTVTLAGQAATLTYTPLGPAAIYTPSVPLSTNDANTNNNFRQFVQLSAGSSGQLRVRFRASSARSLRIVGASFGKWDGITLGPSSSGMTTTPFRLTFGGFNSVDIAAGGTATSDFISHPGLTLSAGDWIIVPFFNDTLDGQIYSTGHTTATTMFRPEGGAVDRSQQQNATGETWATVGSVQPGGSGGANFCVDLVESTAAGGSPYTMTAGTGALTLAGQAVALRAARKLAAGTGAVTLTGQPLALRATRKLTAGTGTLTLTGQAATLKRSYVMPAGTGTVTLLGPTVNLIYSGTGNKLLPAGIGQLTLAGQNVTLRYARKMPAGAGTVTMGGQDVALRVTRKVAAGTGTLTLSGQAVALRSARRLPAGQGTLTLSGQNVTLRYSRKMPAGFGTLTLSGRPVNLTYSGAGNKTLLAGQGTLTLAGQPVTLRYDRKMPAVYGTVTMTGQNVALQRVRKITAGTGNIVLSGQDVNLIYTQRVHYTLPAECGVVRLSGINVDLRTQRRPPKPQMLNFGHTVYLR